MNGDESSGSKNLTAFMRESVNEFQKLDQELSEIGELATRADQMVLNWLRHYCVEFAKENEGEAERFFLTPKEYYEETETEQLISERISQASAVKLFRFLSLF